MTMDVQEVRDQVRIQEWVELIKERNASGMTIRKWCEFKGLSENKYYYWLRRIRKTACTALESHAELAPQIRNESPAFAQINVLPSERPAESDTGISVSVNNVSIHIGSDVPARQIAAMMKVITHVE
jgi:hypothetical protein